MTIIAPTFIMSPATLLAPTTILPSIGPATIYQTALQSSEALDTSLTQARRSLVAIANYRNPGKIIRGQENVTANFDVIYEDESGASDRGQLQAIDTKEIQKISAAVQWAHRINNAYGLAETVPYAGVLITTGLLTPDGGIAGTSGRVVLPSADSLKPAISLIDMARESLRIFLEGENGNYERLTSNYSQLRAQYEEVARSFNVTVDVFLAQILKNAAPQQIASTLDTMEWSLSEQLSFIQNYQISGGMQQVSEWMAASPIIRSPNTQTETQTQPDQGITTATPLLYDVLQAEALKSISREAALQAFEAMGEDAMPLVTRHVDTLNTLHETFKDLLGRVITSNDKQTISEADLEELSAIWEFAWKSDSGRSYFLPELALLYGRLGKREEAQDFLRRWLLSPTEIDAWAMLATSNRKSAFMRSRTSLVGRMLNFGFEDAAEAEQSIDDRLRASKIRDLVTHMWQAAHALTELGDKTMGQNMAHRLFSMHTEGPSFENVPLAFLLKHGGLEGRAVIDRAVQKALNAVKKRRKKGPLANSLDNFIGEAFHSFFVFQDLATAGTTEDRQLVKHTFNNLLQDKAMYLPSLYYYNVATWMLKNGTEEEQTRAEQFLSKWQKHFPAQSLDGTVIENNPAQQRALLERKLADTRPYIRMRAVEELVKESEVSEQSINWIRIITVLKDLVALADPDGKLSLLDSLRHMQSSVQTLDDMRAITAPYREIRARACRLLDKVKPNWDQAMIEQWEEILGANNE